MLAKDSWTTFEPDAGPTSSNAIQHDQQSHARECVWTVWKSDIRGEEQMHFNALQVKHEMLAYLRDVIVLYFFVAHFLLSLSSIIIDHVKVHYTEFIQQRHCDHETTMCWHGVCVMYDCV